MYDGRVGRAVLRAPCAYIINMPEEAFQEEAGATGVMLHLR
jgi:hypothetical protein